MMLSNSRNPEDNQINQGKLIVYYDGSCPKCRRDRRNYEKLSGSHAEDVCWFDITGQESKLHELGIDPHKALSELHVRNTDGSVVSELDAYILLLKKIPWLKPLACLIELPIVRSVLAKNYHRQVNIRLRKRGLL